MDPHVVFDCQKILPNRFALALAAAARSRALTRGAEPRLDRVSANELALLEIAKGCFTPDGLAIFLVASGETPYVSRPDPKRQLGRGSSAAATPSSSLQEMVH
jgi:DNA-directed RNA polymerase subunit omega